MARNGIDGVGVRREGMLYLTNTLSGVGEVYQTAFYGLPVAVAVVGVWRESVGNANSPLHLDCDPENGGGRRQTRPSVQMSDNESEAVALGEFRLTEDLSEYADFHDAYQSIGRFPDEVYTRKRIHSALGYLTPAEFEENWLAQQPKPVLK